MAIVRGVLLLVLGVVGITLGFYLGEFYVSLPTIYKIIGDNRTLILMSRVGFGAIGLLGAIFAYSKASAYIGHLADNLREMPANDKIALFLGALIGLILTFLLSPLISNTAEPIHTMLELALAFVMVYLTTQATTSMRDELRKLLPPYGVVVTDEKAGMERAKILDTNIIIDGRISDICRSGFLEGPIYVPGFVLDELQLIADSGDALKRARGRRGLDILNSMQKEFKLAVRSHDHLIAKYEREPVDSKLVRLAKEMDSTVVTNDFNLNKVAELQGVKVLNVNELANALKPVVLPGEQMNVHVIKEGKESGQGIAYLDDGTMVVVENARRYVGENVDVIVSSVLQTVAGKMIFSNVKEAADEEDELMDRNLRSYYRPGGGRRGPRNH